MGHPKFFIPVGGPQKTHKQTADPSTPLRSGRDDKERGAGRSIFHHLGWAEGPWFLSCPNEQPPALVAFARFFLECRNERINHTES